MSGRYFLLGLAAGLYIMLGHAPAAETRKRTVQRSLPPHGAQSEQFADGEDELERARR